MFDLSSFWIEHGCQAPMGDMEFNVGKFFQQTVEAGRAVSPPRAAVAARSLVGLPAGTHSQYWQ